MFEALDWVLVRAPLRPVEFYRSLASPEATSEALKDPEVRRALAVGGGALLSALERPNKSARDDDRDRGKLLRYLIRMSTRPTPYGLFAGVALAEWGDTTSLRLAGQRRMRTRPDMEWLFDLVLEVEGRPEVRRQLCLVANRAAFFHAGRVFLDEVAPGARGGEAATSVRATGAVLRALELARRPIPYDDLAADLLSRAGATREKVETLIDELWQRTLLLTDLRPPLDGGAPAAYVAERLSAIPPALDAVESLGKVRAAAAAWDASPTSAGEAPLRKLLQVAEGPAKTDDRGSLVQVDMAIALDGRQLTRAVADEAARAAELLLRLGPLPFGSPQVVGYRNAFESRYSSAAEVPLLELLDPRFGLGPMSGFGHGHGVDSERAATRAQTLQNLALAAARDRQLVVELDDETVGRLELWQGPPTAAPVSVEVAVFVLAPSVEAIDAGKFRLLIGPNLGGSAAGKNLGRFADLLAPDGEAALARAAGSEQAHDPTKLWAELVYLPRRLRSANVVIRPTVRSHSIVVGTTPALPAERTIPLDELVVRIVDGRFRVRWPREGAEIVACAAHMLNNAHAPEAFRFLEAVTHDNAPLLSSFDWGPAASFPFLPRVQCGRIILSPAEWRIDAESAASELAAGDDDDFAAAVAAWRHRWQVPRQIYLTFADNRLLLDLEDGPQVDELRAEVRKLERPNLVVLQEPLPALEDAWLRGPDGHYMTELVVPLARVETPDEETGSEPVETIGVRRATAAARIRPPGSEWLFAKLYGPPAFEDDLIAGPLREFCEAVRPAGLADEWFFVRYTDPDPHLRVRFRGDPQRLIGALIPQLTGWARELIDAGMCSRFALDTYDREIERYGGEKGIAVAESIFAADSRAVAEILALALEQSFDFDRTLLAVLSIDDLLRGLGLLPEERLAWYRGRVESRQASGAEFRQRSGTLRALLSDSEQLARERGGDALKRVLAARRAALAPLGRELERIANQEELGQPRTALLRSFVHLHCNRLGGSGWAVEEQALGLLLRAHESLERAPVGESTRE
jgi:thiopeptide-type bacteriocin biosynthesis protein